MNIVLSIIRVFLVVYTTLCKPVIHQIYAWYYRNEDKPKPLPPVENTLLLIPAVSLAYKIRSKQVTSHEAVSAYINRIKQVQPLVNCVVKDCFDEALAEAKRVDKLIAEDSSELRDDGKYSEKSMPLLGVPFSCKECIWVKGMPNATGVFARKNFVVPYDADVVKYIRQAGAILTCVTNTSEACMWMESNNYMYGTTKNPYNLSRIVGGSSGGEGCIVSSAGSVFGVGSDIGGSIRMPAFFNGVYGHKCSSKFISNQVQHPAAKDIQETMLATGPICRYASDLRLLFKIFAGPRYSEIASKFDANIDLKKLNYFYIEDMQGNILCSQPSKDTRDALRRAISCVESTLGVKVRKIELKKFKIAFQIWGSMMNNGRTCSNDFSKLLNDSDEPINAYWELVRTMLGRQDKHTLPALALAIFERLPMASPQHYIEQGRLLKQELQEILGENGVLFSPSYPVVAPFHNEPMATNTLDYIYYGIYNSLGLPVTQCPMGLSERERLPTGVQVVAGAMCDHLTIRLAEYLESNLVGWVPGF